MHERCSAFYVKFNLTVKLALRKTILIITLRLMKLKTLHIKGFKSFANDTILHFQDDVIGIVGPNGSGKSNIVDAIRWVLGEQKSKELRLESMGDVIFNGTKSKKEAASAMVALTFENDRGVLPSEYQFVTISRTLYRSGESEYRLNNVICRLKDITTLFLDTGIGSNSYAIIALGMVDDILENKENARRRMFEQAAGVSKYKVRKRETLLKLKNTEEDLNRIEDLLFEIDGNVKALEKQAKRTQKYNEIKEKYKELSIHHAVFSIQSLKEKYKTVAEDLRKYQDAYRENDTKLTALHANLEKEKKANLDKELALNEKQKKMNELVSSIRTMEGEKVLLQQKEGFTKQAKENLKKSIDEAGKNIEVLEKELAGLKDRIEKEIQAETILKTEFHKYQEHHQKLKEKYQVLKTEFDDKQKQKMALEKNQFEVEKELAILSNNIENQSIEQGRAKDEWKDKEAQDQKIKLSYDTLVAEVNQKSKELTRAMDGEEKRTKTLEEKEQILNKTKDELAIVSRTLDSKQNEHDLLKGMIDNFEGYPESIRYLHENWQKNPVILGDILDVEEGYKAAIESYLEPYLNYFIVQNVKEAYKGVHLLHSSQKGKAHFFILDHFKNKKTNAKVPGFLTPAVDHVNVEEKFSSLLDYMLQDCYIFDGDPEMVIDQPEVDDKWVILSKHGHFVKSKYSVSGGAIGLFEGKKIGRKKNLENLAKQIQTLEKQKSSLEEKITILLKDIQSLKQNHDKVLLDSLNKEINEKQQNLAKIQVQLDSFQKFQAEFNEKLDKQKLQLKQWEVQKSELEKSLQQLAKQKEVLFAKDHSEDGEVARLSEELQAAAEQVNQENIKMIRHQNLIENLKKEWDYKDNRLKELKEKLESDQYRMLGEERAAINVQDEIRQIDNALVENYRQKKEFNEALSATEQIYFQAKNVITQIDDEIRVVQKDLNQAQHIIQQLKDEFTELKFKISGVGERLKIEFNIPVNDIINREPDPDLAYDELETDIEKLKQRIANYGDINPLALEAYNEMFERFQSIQSQKNDIVSAKDSLLETIKEIETTATKQFDEAFQKIRNNFILVFRELFTNDDTCDLLLEDPSNPLDSEIEIIAKPKGKKPKSISQLSGGEKTLTATALLFALYLLKPAPFCIFDEVDAPLDDANIQKFNNIIKKFSAESQFIIVTHNKSTMVEVDTLYGVYMQEQGISAVSAVDFKKLEAHSKTS